MGDNLAWYSTYLASSCGIADVDLSYLAQTCRVVETWKKIPNQNEWKT